MTNLEYLIKKFPRHMASAITSAITKKHCTLYEIQCGDCPFNGKLQILDCDSKDRGKIYDFLLSEKDEESQANETV